MKSNLRYYREAHYLQIKELAAKANVSTQYVSNIENERSNPSFPTMRKLAEALGEPVQKVFPRDEKDIIPYPKIVA